MRTPNQTRYLIFFILGFIVLGLWHHLYFSLSNNDFLFFKNAYDEDTYVLLPFGTYTIRPDRILSGSIMSAIHSASGSLNFTLVALDGLLPPIVFIAAYCAGSSIFKLPLTRCLFAVVLIFSSDLFSLGSTASYPGPFPTLANFRHLIGAAFVPPIETSYLSIYRSPEPQVSYIVGFLLIGNIIRLIARNDDTISRSESIAFAVVQILLMLCYAVVAYPILVAEFFVMIAILLVGAPRRVALLAVMLFVSIIVAAIETHLVLPPTSGVIYPSRMPTVTVGSILSLLLVATSATVLWKRKKLDLRTMAALAFAVTPLALTNQQVVTGIMASAREWERYLNLPLVVVAAGLLISQVNWNSYWQQPTCALAILVVLVFVTKSSIWTYKLWLPDNLQSVALVRAVRAASPKLSSDTILVLDPPGYAPLVEARFGSRLPFVLDYTEVFANPIPSTTTFQPTKLANALFDYWRYMHVSPEEAQKILETEARSRGGYYSGFVFNICDYWYPCTDGRNVKTEKIAAQIPAVIADYRAQLAQPVSKRKIAFVGINISSVPAGAIKIAEARTKNKTAVVWTDQNQSF